MYLLCDGSLPKISVKTILFNLAKHEKLLTILQGHVYVFCDKNYYAGSNAEWDQ